ncbi:hypothetical protein Fmac_016008 [Flemingia macrophylla]|uniref:Uncharacterized protein n=1 Tax=Flemingia macrophylla TaxID=520843 RepID=A0ABD1MG70_9FABA
MKTLIICAPKATLNLSKPSPWKPNFLPKPNHPIIRLKPPSASAKGFSPPSVAGDVNKNEKPLRRRNNDGDEDLPTPVMYRLIRRILFSVVVPMGLGLTFLHVFGVLKENQVYDAPLWLPFVTTLLTFGASSIGIAYGALSTSLEEESEGSFLGLEQFQKNWVEMWQEEEKDDAT